MWWCGEKRRDVENLKRILNIRFHGIWYVKSKRLFNRKKNKIPFWKLLSVSMHLVCQRRSSNRPCVWAKRKIFTCLISTSVVSLECRTFLLRAFPFCLSANRFLVETHTFFYQFHFRRDLCVCFLKIFFFLSKYFEYSF